MTAPLVKPPRLRPGDVIGLVAPSGVVDEALVQRGTRNIESLGLRVKRARNLFAAQGGYAGTVDERVRDLHEMFLDPDVRGLWAARGGSGCAALVPHIDYDLVRHHPKALVGYSDLTALHLALLQHAGLVSFHGPVSSSGFVPYSTAALRAVLMEPARRLVLDPAPEHQQRAAAEPQFARRTYGGGVARGRLVGGNLSVLASLVGTPHLPDMRGALLFLEDVGEAPYRIDRMLTQLGQSGVLSQAAGVALGIFQRSEATDAEPSLGLQQVLSSHLARLGRPACYGLSFGHVAPQMTLPLGCLAELDAELGRITLLEPAVT